MKNTSLQFKEAKLLKLDYEFNHSFKNDGYVNLDIRYKTSIKKADNNAFVSLELNLFENNNKANILFYIDISMGCEFFWDKELKDMNIDKLLKSNGSTILLSYIRTYISNITLGAGFPPLIIPLIDFTENEFNKWYQVTSRLIG